MELSSIRETFLPDKGCVFIRVDLAQVEDRIVKMCTRQPRMIKLANLHPDEYDCFKEYASYIYNVPQKEVTYDQRYLAKRTCHGMERGLMGKKLSNILLDDGYQKTPQECQKMLDKLLDFVWEIRDHYFPFIREMMIRNKCLTNCFGRQWDITYERFCADLYMRGYSWIPQSTCADLLNTQGLVFAGKYIKKNKLRSRINAQVHDEVITSCYIEEGYAYTKALMESLSKSIEIYGNKLSVPCSVIVGKNWADKSREFSVLPSEEEFVEVMKKVYEEVQEMEV